jgi:predicted ATP-binding protein involved in virulence
MARIDLLTLAVDRPQAQRWNVSFQWEADARPTSEPGPCACIIHVAAQSLGLERLSLWCIAPALEQFLASKARLPAAGIARTYWYMKGVLRCLLQRFDEVVAEREAATQRFVLGLDETRFFLELDAGPEVERITGEVTNLLVDAGQIQHSLSLAPREALDPSWMPEPREWPRVEPGLRDANTPAEQAAHRALREFYAAWQALRDGARLPDERSSLLGRAQDVIARATPALSAIEEWRHLPLDGHLARLDDEELARLSAYLLELDGFTVMLQVALEGGVRADIMAEDPAHQRLIVECRAAAPDLARLQEAAYQLAAYQKLVDATRAILVTSSLIDTPLDLLEPLGIDLWDRRTLRQKIARDPRAEVFLNELTAPPKTRQPGQLRVRELLLQNFRGMSSLRLDLSETRTTILVGLNGTGKTTILDALAKPLSWLTQRVASATAKGASIGPEDIKNGTRDATIVLRAWVEGMDTSWSLVGTEPGARRVRRPHLTSLRAPIAGMQKALEMDPSTSVPVAVYYPVNRAVIEIPVRIRKRNQFGQLAAYTDALTTAKARNFRLFFEWFRLREDIENERRLSEREHRDPELEAVRQAIYSLMPGFSNLRIQRSPQRMLIDKHGERVNVSQLSDGEKCLLAMVGDLARRLAIANPGLARPLEGSGVVLIDEIDLHLHPRWQREIIPALERTFPNCQFILTTHSPQVLSQVRENAVILLARGDQGIEIRARRGVYGWDTNRILEELMETPPRPHEVQDELNEYFALIASGRLDEAQQLRAKLEQDIGKDEPSFKKADVLVRYRQRVASS